MLKLNFLALLLLAILTFAKASAPAKKQDSESGASTDNTLAAKDVTANDSTYVGNSEASKFSFGTTGTDDDDDDDQDEDEDDD